MFIEIDEIVIYTNNKTTFSFEKILQDLNFNDLEFIVQLKRASLFSSYAQNKIVFYPRTDDLVGNYTIPFMLFNTTLRKRTQQTFKL